MSFLKSAAFDGLLKHALKVTAEAGIDAAMGQYRKRSHGDIDIESREDYIQPVTHGDMKVFKQMGQKQFNDLHKLLGETKRKSGLLADIHKEQQEMEDMLDDLFESGTRIKNKRKVSNTMKNTMKKTNSIFLDNTDELTDEENEELDLSNLLYADFGGNMLATDDDDEDDDEYEENFYSSSVVVAPKKTKSIYDM